MRRSHKIRRQTPGVSPGCFLHTVNASDHPPIAEVQCRLTGLPCRRIADYALSERGVFSTSRSALASSLKRIRAAIARRTASGSGWKMLITVIFGLLFMATPPVRALLHFTWDYGVP